MFIWQIPPGLHYTSRHVLRLGGLGEEVEDKVPHAHRGFAFVVFELTDEAAAAIDNVDGSELFGRTVRVRLANPVRTEGGSSRPGEPAAKKAWSNPQVYMDIKIGNKLASRIQMLLRLDVVPVTAVEYHEKLLGFVRCLFHSIEMILCLLSRANSGPNTNSSQFFLTCGRSRWGAAQLQVHGSMGELGGRCSTQERVGGTWGGAPSHPSPSTLPGFCPRLSPQGSKDEKPQQKVIIADCGEYV
ncbi:unnamed protein product [Nyctereutes procyonoides]|uniref:(raccoon dog) hypothetical protein n=1 Tax=Nyctereutes procyonoides TaxID=34880 RepID=A0A811Z672_NYCPR|nr:unnamed protein product [Nyctereutes procyonoides]